MDSDASRVLQVQRAKEDSIACYRETYEGKEIAAFYLSLDRLKSKTGHTKEDVTTSVSPSHHIMTQLLILLMHFLSQILPLYQLPRTKLLWTQNKNLNKYKII
jgi:hypothetical protein